MKLSKIYCITLILITICSFSSQGQQSTTNKPIRFTKFDVIANNNRISINLTTDGAVATNYFEIQKSADGVNYKTIALILGPDPKQSTCDCYGCYDKLVKGAEHIYYRARHIGLDGSEQLTESKLLAKL